MVTEYHLALYDSGVSIHEKTTTDNRVVSMSEFIRFDQEWQGMSLRDVQVRISDQKHATIVVGEQGFMGVTKFSVLITDVFHWLPAHFAVRHLFSPQLEKQICDIAIGVEDDLPF